jgi:hypothetical protein
VRRSTVQRHERTGENSVVTPAFENFVLGQKSTRFIADTIHKNTLKTSVGLLYTRILDCSRFGAKMAVFVLMSYVVACGVWRPLRRPPKKTSGQGHQSPPAQQKQSWRESNKVLPSLKAEPKEAELSPSKKTRSKTRSRAAKN